MDLNLKNLELDNYGERLIPGYSHSPLEVIRHRSTYQVFRKIIERDVQLNPLLSKEKIKVLDLGCGSGHGSFLIAQIPNAHVYAIDISEGAISFAKENYAQENITFEQSSAEDFLKKDAVFDYVVSRHALEHIQDAISIIQKLKYKNRLLLSVPYKEVEGNPFHLHNNIDESFFDAFPNKEFIYENLQGVNDVRPFVAEFTNSFACISSNPGLAKVVDILDFPQQPYEFKGVEKRLFHFQEEVQRLVEEKRCLVEEKAQLIEDKRQLVEGTRQLVKDTIQLAEEKQHIQDLYSALYNSRSLRMLRSFKRILGIMGVSRYK